MLSTCTPSPRCRPKASTHFSAGLDTGSLCSAHGQCNQDTATCLCAASPTTGHWAGPQCNRCAAGYSGPNCALQCPTAPATGLACSGHGRCSLAGTCLCAVGRCGTYCEATDCASCPAGRWGPGCRSRCLGNRTADGNCTAHGHCTADPAGVEVCTCDSGFGGAQCLPCPAGSGGVCSGHGACDPVTGACWCHAGYAGPACAQRCARAPPLGLVCGGPGQGTCNPQDGVCVCTMGYAGTACETVCPRAAGAVCAGHGTCDTLGRCTCAALWAGAECADCAVGRHGPDCRRVCVQGHTRGTACVCHAGWAGTDCSVPCAGGAAWPCLGHGECRAGAAGDGTCSCDQGWSGADCSVPCPGAGAPCSGHGRCLGGCVCDASDVTGHWAGTACDRCASPWLGPECRDLCPSDAAGVPCSGHGACLGDALVCECHGNFAPPLCSECRTGYYGPRCAGMCPGGACRPCAGHGRCDDGRNGTGACACDGDALQGHFSGSDCRRCAAGFYGVSCTRVCPGGAAQPCNGHGVCADGAAGDGMCTCDVESRRGFWTGAACALCRSGFYGPDCAAACPSGAAGVCGGHGVCSDGRNGSGVCTCAPLYSGSACDLLCPHSASDVPCGGHGLCVAAVAATEARCACEPQWAGPACGSCAAGFSGADCDLRCPDCGAHGACDEALGRCVCDRGWGGEGCERQCPGGDVICFGHGTCGADGRCSCTQSLMTGHWGGSDCLPCAEGWAGLLCHERCPADAYARTCGGRGQCIAGKCICAAGTCGAACGETNCTAYDCPEPVLFGDDCTGRCPSDGGVACGGHGFCDGGRRGSGACLCVESWSGPFCNISCPGEAVACNRQGFCSAQTEGCACLPGFLGTDCAHQCPGGWQTPCNGRGTCRAGAAGAPVCDCDAEYGGASCEHVCPRGAGAAVCDGHGACVTEPEGAAVCLCEGNFAGAACEDCREGWWGDACADVCYQGRTEGRVCECDANWAGEDCSVPCPGASVVPCTGHGVCNDTRHGDGSCICAEGWQGSLCFTPCPGLLVGVGVCSGHGTCTADATCRCHDARNTGHWTGPLCDACADLWLGEACDRTCPLGQGSAVLCGGHGGCDPDTESCICSEDAETGFWDIASNCTECLAYYYGLECRVECPGGACFPCSSHGTCDDGRRGTGTCTCDVHWRGEACSQCTAGRYGPDCNATCPSGGPDRATCTGHGTCLDGRIGSGECICVRAADDGFWDGAACDACAGGFYGTSCAAPCPGPAGQPCSGHGRCDDGVGGMGECSCVSGYAGRACEIMCPSTNGAPCDGHGRCIVGVDGALTCDCTAEVNGFYAGPACERCAAAWTGLGCDVPCETGPNGMVCSGHGTCEAGVFNRPSVCACDSGYAGALCNETCPGGATFLCRHHGVCDPATAECICHADPERGYWAGADCRDCAPGWSGPSCLLPCPRGGHGDVPCSGAGGCYSGLCFCYAGACGTACNVTGSACDALACPVGVYGPGCSGRCSCSGHGRCENWVYGVGVCQCDAGYAGADCALLCPGGPAQPCAGHGLCDEDTGLCICEPTYGTADCGRRCPSGALGPCSGRGICNDTAAGDGACACAPGYAGPDCGLVCPGSGLGPSPCSGHGLCDSVTAVCTCAGHWAGPGCAGCRVGWFGAACDRVCVHGTTAGTVCRCEPGFGGPDCSRECPGPPGDRCHGHGWCLDGHTRSAACACDPGWYDPGCRTFCEASRCFAHVSARTPRPHPQCDPATGACVCQRNRTGYWEGPVCTVCLVGYWGPECDRLCQCTGHGRCGWLDGVCECFRDATQGFWGGDNCDACLDGYFEPHCRARDVAISRVAEVPALALSFGSAATGIIFADGVHKIAYTGGRPLWVLHTENKSAYRSLDLGGTIRSASILPDRVAFLVVDSGTGVSAMQTITRGPNPVRLSAMAAARHVRRPRARRVRALAVAAPERFSAIHQSPDGWTYWTALTDAEFSVLGFSRSLTRERELRIPATAFPLDLLRSAIFWPDAAPGPALLLSGARNGTWGLVAVVTPALAHAVSLTDHLVVPECAGGACRALAGAVVLDGVLLLALEQPGAVLLVKARVPSLANLSSAWVEGSAVLDWLGSGIAVTALAVDALTRAAYLAAHLPLQPSVLYKVHYDDLVVYGQHRLLSRGGTKVCE